VFAEASDPQKPGDNAILTLAGLGPTQSFNSLYNNRQDRGVCLSFWYHMYGPQIGTLNVHVITVGQKEVRWSKTGTQTNRWTQGTIYIDSLWDYSVRSMCWYALAQRLARVIVMLLCVHSLPALASPERPAAVLQRRASMIKLLIYIKDLF